MLLASRVDALALRLDKVDSHLVLGSPLGSVEVHAIYETCGVQGHTFAKRYNGSSTIEHANTLYGFNTPP